MPAKRKRSKKQQKILDAAVSRLLDTYKQDLFTEVAGVVSVDLVLPGYCKHCDEHLDDHTRIEGTQTYKCLYDSRLYEFGSMWPVGGILRGIIGGYIPPRPTARFK